MQRWKPECRRHNNTENLNYLWKHPGIHRRGKVNKKWTGERVGKVGRGDQKRKKEEEGETRGDEKEGREGWRGGGMTRGGMREKERRGRRCLEDMCGFWPLHLLVLYYTSQSLSLCMEPEFKCFLMGRGFYCVCLQRSYWTQNLPVRIRESSLPTALGRI